MEESEPAGLWPLEIWVAVFGALIIGIFGGVVALQSPTGAALRGLGARLRALRVNAGMSGVELASALGAGWRQSKISKIETGRQLPSTEEVIAWATAVQSEPSPLLALHGKASASYGAWRNKIAGAGGAAAFQDEIGALETSCSFLAEFQPAMIPGRLQTPAYMREMAIGDEFLVDDGISEDALSRLIAAKIRRQSILYEPGRRIVHVVGEAALRTRIRGITASTMREQLSHLTKLARLPGHDFCVLPLDAVSPIPAVSAFAMYDTDLVVIEALVGDLQITEPSSVTRYVRWIEQLLEAALTGDEAIQLCETIRARFETPPRSPADPD